LIALEAYSPSMYMYMYIYIYIYMYLWVYVEQFKQLYKVKSKNVCLCLLINKGTVQVSAAAQWKSTLSSCLYKRIKNKSIHLRGMRIKEGGQEREEREVKGSARGAGRIMER